MQIIAKFKWLGTPSFLKFLNLLLPPATELGIAFLLFSYSRVYKPY